MAQIEERVDISNVESHERDELPISPSESHVKRTGTVTSAVAHIINGVIGSGVLSLAWAVAQLGWIAGPLLIIGFGLLTIASSNLVCDVYRYPHPELGRVRNKSYAKAVGNYLGKKNMWLVSVFIYESFYGFAIAFTITAATSMRAIFQANCYHNLGHNARCSYGENEWMLLYGVTQIIFAQIPDLHSADFLSVIAAVMSFAYSSIGLGLGLAKTIGNGVIKGHIRGISGVSTPQKIYLTFQAIGNIAFTYNYNIIILDIQDTLKEPPENRKMKKAVHIGISICSVFFFCCGCFGYAAFGNLAPGNLLTGFGFYEPYWLVDFANACIVLHLVGGYSIYSQPLFAAVDRKLKKVHPDSKFVHKEYRFKLPLLPCFRLNLFRLCFRTIYVASTTGLAIAFPYFNEVLGVLGSLNFWPIMIYFPIKMYLKQEEVATWTPIWIFLQVVQAFGLIVSILAMVGSVEGLLRSRFG